MAKILLILTLFSMTCLAETVQFDSKVSPWVTFEVSSTAKSFLVALETTAETPLYVADLIDPSGKVYVQSNHGTASASRIPPFLYSTIRAYNRITQVTKGLGSILVPNRDTEDEITPGTWRMRIGAMDQIKEAHFSVQESFGLKSQSLAFKVHLDQQALFPDLIIMQEILQSVVDLYQRYDIDLELNLVARSFDLQVPYLLDEYVEASQVGSSNTPVINLVRAANPYGKKDFQGLAGCLPFFLPRYVDKHCAIGIAFEDDWHMDTRRFGKVIAHEIAHFLGIFHLSDDYYPFGQVFDPISDTDESVEFSNVMHKTSDYYDVLEFTAGQVKVMKRHPMLTN